MKCLSLWQPWATLLAAGLKRVETRGWELGHRGPLLIHAAKKWTGELAELCLASPFREHLLAFGVPAKPHAFTAEDFTAMKGGWQLPLGFVVGRVDVVACLPTEEVGVMDCEAAEPCYWPGNPKYFPLQISRSEKAFGDYSAGRFAILCGHPVRFDKPIPFKGRQGLFDVPDELLKVEAAS